MKAIIKRQIKSYLKNPVFWVGILVVFIGVYRLLAPYLTIHYVEKDEKLATEEGKSGIGREISWMGTSRQHPKNSGNSGKSLFLILL